MAGHHIGDDLIKQIFIKKFNDAEILFRPCTRLTLQVYLVCSPHTGIPSNRLDNGKQPEDALKKK